MIHYGVDLLIFTRIPSWSSSGTVRQRSGPLLLGSRRALRIWRICLPRSLVPRVLQS